MISACAWIKLNFSTECAQTIPYRPANTATSCFYFSLQLDLSHFQAPHSTRPAGGPPGAFMKHPFPREAGVGSAFSVCSQWFLCSWLHPLSPLLPRWVRVGPLSFELFPEALTTHLSKWEGIKWGNRLNSWGRYCCWLTQQQLDFLLTKPQFCSGKPSKTLTSTSAVRCGQVK